MNLLKKMSKFLFYLILSVSFFYFFEVPFLVETAFAEEISSQEGEKVEASSKETEAMKKEETWVSSIKNFLVYYKWHIFILVGVASAAFCLFWIVTFTGDGGAGLAAAEGGALHTNYVPSLQQRLEAIARHPDLVRNVDFFEDITSYRKIFEHTPSEMPNKFTAGAHIYADATLQNVLAVVSDVKNPVTGEYIGNLYAVYPAKPLLHAENVIPILSNIGELPKTNVLLKYADVINWVQDPSYKIPELFSNNPYGWSNDPSLKAHITEGFKNFGLLDYHFNKSPNQNLILSYQKVVLVDPLTFHYNYYHKFAIHPLNAEALTTPFETAIDGKIIKAFYLKDLEAIQYANKLTL